MTRDDSSGGWVPLGGAGLSHVTICRGGRGDDSDPGGFLIRGQRLRDQAVILECDLKKDLTYNKVNPIFHHWKVDEDKFGLTFQSPADAVTFEQSIKKVIEELAKGSLTSSSSSQVDAVAAEDISAAHTDSESSSNSRKEMLPKHITIVTSESSSSCYIRPSVSEEFRAGLAPAESQPNQVETRPLRHGGYSQGEDPESARELWAVKGYEDYRRAAARRSQEPDADKIDLCVQFAKGQGGGGGSPGTECPLKASPACRIQAPGSPRLKGAAEEEAAASRCVYCRDVFRHRDNGRGRCQDAPDPIERCVYQVSCMWCAESMLYHCMSDSEGDYSDPCSCDAGSRHFCARWLGLAVLSLMAPCMCCYLPLRACHHCGEHWGCCGGKHKAVH